MADAIESLLGCLGAEIEDPEEEAFLLFSQSIPSENQLGIVDPKAPALELTINGQDLVVAQSPSVLSSNRPGGTTGAVVWKVTPLFASWLASPTNILHRTGVLSPSATVLELGCGVSALVGLALGPLVSRYVLSDQPYVARFVEQNLAQNHKALPARNPGRRGKGKTASPAPSSSAARGGNICFRALDWEADTPTRALTGCNDARSFDAVLAGDCVFNDALIAPFVQTCLDVCRLRSADGSLEGPHGGRPPPCVCIVAQQLRDPEVFDAWLKEFCAKGFRAWRIPDKELPEGLRSNAGFVVHVGVLRQ